jgi:hypothetical protein
MYITIDYDCLWYLSDKTKIIHTTILAQKYVKMTTYSLII